MACVATERRVGEPEPHAIGTVVRALTSPQISPTVGSSTIKRVWEIGLLVCSIQLISAERSLIRSLCIRLCASDIT